MHDSPSRNDDTAYASAVRDATRDLTAQRAAFLAEPLASEMLEAMPGPGFVLNPRRQLVALNRALADALGLADPATVIGARLGEVALCVHASERATGCGTTTACSRCGAVNAILDCLMTRRRVTRECRIQTAGGLDGGALDLRLHATHLQLGAHEYVVVGLENIRDEKRREVLEHVFFGELLGAARRVRETAAWLAAGEPLPDDAGEELRGIAALSGGIVERIETQRSVFAAERGALDVNPVPVDLALLLDEVLEAMRAEPVAAARTIRFESVRHCPVESDPDLIERAVRGLVRNALEATPVGGTVELTCEYDHEVATLSVHNDGVMPAEVQLQVFQRSYSTRGEEGRGVGTWAARLIVERYLGGKLAFMSEPRVGTLFLLMIPRRTERLAAA